MIPTIEQVMKCYQVVARTERAKTGRPGEETVLNCLRGTRSVCAAAGVALTAPVDELTRQRIDAALASFMARDVSRLSSWSYVCQLRGIFARWCLPYYRDAGWEIPKLELPAFRAQPPRYLRPCPEVLARVKAWYQNLCRTVKDGKETNGELWLAATMMLEFAMRNGDILRLKNDNFVARDDRHYLSYTPHKTELTSGRRVFWPIHQDIWSILDDCGGMSCFDITDEVFIEMNRQLRALGLRGNKGAYELRKICIDHVYQRFGAEMAVSISGDDIRTISRYYADPAQPNIGNVRVVDLL